MVKYRISKNEYNYKCYRLYDQGINLTCMNELMTSQIQHTLQGLLKLGKKEASPFSYHCRQESRSNAAAYLVHLLILFPGNQRKGNHIAFKTIRKLPTIRPIYSATSHKIKCTFLLRFK